MKKVKIYIPDANNNYTDSTYFKNNATKIKKISDNGTSYNHTFVGENEFIKFLQGATNVPDVMEIKPIENKYVYKKIEINSIPTLKTSDISTIIQD